MIGAGERRLRIGRRWEGDRQRLRPHEAADDERQVAQGLRGDEQIHLAALRAVFGWRQQRKSALQLAARNAFQSGGHADSNRGGRVVGHRALRIPEAAAAV